MAGPSTHDDLKDLAAFYVLGSLPRVERDAFETHLATCAECLTEVRSLRNVTDAMAYAAPQHEPPPALRERVLASVGAARGTIELQPAVFTKRRAEPRLQWLTTAAALAATLVLGIYTLQLRQRVSVLSGQLRDAITRADASDRAAAEVQRTAGEAQSEVAVLSAPDLARVDLVGQPSAPRSSGRVYWSRSRGLVFTATDLPPLNAGRVYQLWIVTDQAPISAGLVTPDLNGRATAMFRTSPDVPQPVAMALTEEPQGGVPAPTGERYLIGQAH
jgi:anti-sigma-K factor RskA